MTEYTLLVSHESCTKKKNQPKSSNIGNSCSSNASGTFCYWFHRRQDCLHTPISHSSVPLAKQAVSFQLSFLLCFLQPSTLKSTDSLLRINSQEKNKIRFKQILRPLVHLIMSWWKILHFPIYFSGNCVGSCAVPVSFRKTQNGEGNFKEDTNFSVI